MVEEERPELVPQYVPIKPDEEKLNEDDNKTTIRLHIELV